MKNVEGEKYGEYANHIYPIITKIMKELGVLSRVKKQKIVRHHQLPAEAVYLFKALERNGLVVNLIPEILLYEGLKYIFGRIDRTDDYDKALLKKIGKMETLRWRQGNALKDTASFQRIVATLKEHAVAKGPKTIAQQQPRAKLFPRGEYHKSENLT